MRQAYELPASGGDPAVAQWFLTPTNAPHNATYRRIFDGLYNVSLSSNVTIGCSNGVGASCEIGGSGLEANLDAQYLSSASPRTTTVEQYFDLSDPYRCTEPVCWLEELVDCVSECTGGDSECDAASCYGQPAPSVVSISWGVPEIDLAPANVYAFNKMASHLALLGLTIVAAAGDGGAAGIYPYDDGKWYDGCLNCHQQQCGSTYQPLFPASSPFVTTVGATQGLEDGRREVVCAAGSGGGITSGGGFSTIKYSEETMPFQAPHVRAYLRTAAGQAATPGFFSRHEYGEGQSYDYNDATEQLDHSSVTRRGYPDLALAGSAVQMVDKGKIKLVDGTSAAAPLFAAMVSNVVAQRRAQGWAHHSLAWRSGTMHDPLRNIPNDADADDAVTAANVTHGYRLGWLNPTLYAAPAGSFNDVTEGHNLDGRGKACPTGASAYHDTYGNDHNEFEQNGDRQNVFLNGPAGFEASIGWDPASGHGSVTNAALARLFPLNVGPSSGGGCLGCDYYDQGQDESTAEEWTEQHSVPSPPSSSYG